MPQPNSAFIQAYRSALLSTMANMPSGPQISSYAEPPLPSGTTAAAHSNSTSKREKGQFYTTVNPFNHNAFHRWLKTLPEYPATSIVEPFAGANNIIQMIHDLGYPSFNWGAFDIDPEAHADNSTSVPVIVQDTLANFPTGFSAAITNPPYLAKNSAMRRGLPFPESPHEDLYQISLEVMLANLPYVAAIIPESFISQKKFFNRLQSFISLPFKMFEDTDTPVCLALFGPESRETPDFDLWSGPTFIGKYSTLQQMLPQYSPAPSPWVFNDPKGAIFLQAIDNTLGPSISFKPASDAPPLEVKVSSRSQTLIGYSATPPLSATQITQLCARANALLKEHRTTTHDTFLTSFKGLRSDGQFRRRLDFKLARLFLDRAAFDLKINNTPSA